MTVTTILPATLVPGPDRNWKVSSLDSLATSNGIAYVAKLRLDGKLVGTIENQGNGGGSWASFTTGEMTKAWRESAAAYGGEEELADALVQEFEVSKLLNGKTKLHVLPVGKTPIDDNPPWDFAFVSYKASPNDPTAVAFVREKHPGARIWRNQQWEEI